MVGAKTECGELALSLGVYCSTDWASIVAAVTIPQAELGSSGAVVSTGTDTFHGAGTGGSWRGAAAAAAEGCTSGGAASDCSTATDSEPASGIPGAAAAAPLSLCAGM
jgi:hypothetical protein